MHPNFDYPLGTRGFLVTNMSVCSCAKRHYERNASALCACRQYEGQLKMRYTVQQMKPVEYVTESKRMIEQLVKLRIKAESS